MEVTNSWKLIEFSKSSIKMKIFKTFFEVQTASHLKLTIQHPYQIKVSLRLQKSNFLTEIYYEYTDICVPSVLRMHYLGV